MTFVYAEAAPDREIGVGVLDLLDVLHGDAPRPERKAFEGTER
jgi:hypothetical protein